MNRVLLKFFLLIFSYHEVAAQCNFNVRVFDIENNTVLPYIKITIVSSEKSYETFTDINGTFNFKEVAAGFCVVSSSSFNYKFDTLLNLQKGIDSVFLYAKKSNMPDYIVLKSNYNSAGAKQAIIENNIEILLPGGIVSTPITAADVIFEEKYNVKYVSQGCVRFPEEDEAAYNNIIFIFLDEKFGLDWRKNVNKNAIGLQEYVEP